MTIPYRSFEGSSTDAARAYAAIFRPHHPAGACPSCGHPRTDGPSGVLYAAVKAGPCWRCVPNISQAEPAAGSTVAVTMSDAAEGKRVFDALAEGGEVEVPYEPTFWSPGFGRLTDRWGTHWMMDTAPPPRGGA